MPVSIHRSIETTSTYYDAAEWRRWQSRGRKWDWHRKGDRALPASSVLILSASAMLASVLTEAAHGQRLRVERAMPVVGRPVRLEARSAGPEGAGATFRVADAAGTLVWEAESAVRGGSASASWTPLAAGPYTVTATVGETALDAVEVFSVNRELHFNYWACPLTQRYVTSVMENGADASVADLWLDRGVLPLVWRGGHCDFELRRTAEAFAEAWAPLPPGRAGIMIDEFGAGGPEDEILARALLLLREMAPSVFQAPYCVAVSGELMSAAFRQADLALLETYCYDWRGYEGITSRVGSAVAAGAGDHAIAVLGLQPWATTERELRAQVAFARTTFPDMPGIGFFPDVPPHLSEAVDRAVYDYFLGPALLLGDGRVRNIGQLRADGVRVSVEDGAELYLGDLPPGAAVEVPGAVAIVPDAGYTVILHRDPTTQPLPTAESVAEVRALERELLGGIEPIALARETLELRFAESDNPDVDGQVQGAELDLGLDAGGPAALSFDIEFERAYFYGNITVALEGEGRLGVSFNHGDHDRDLPPDQPRAVFFSDGPDRVHVRATCPVGLRPAERYHVFAGISDDTARMSIADEAGTMIWESGPMLFPSSVRPATLRFEVTAFDGSAVAAEGDGSVRLRGVSGGPKPSPYVLEAVVSNIRARH